MKRIVVLLTVLTMAFSIVSCGGTQQETTEEATEMTEAGTEAEAETETAEASIDEEYVEDDYDEYEDEYEEDYEYVDEYVDEDAEARIEKFRNHEGFVLNFVRNLEDQPMPETFVWNAIWTVPFEKSYEMPADFQWEDTKDKGFQYIIRYKVGEDDEILRIDSYDEFMDDDLEVPLEDIITLSIFDTEIYNSVVHFHKSETAAIYGEELTYQDLFKSYNLWFYVSTFADTINEYETPFHTEDDEYGNNIIYDAYFSALERLGKPDKLYMAEITEYRTEQMLAMVYELGDRYLVFFSEELIDDDLNSTDLYQFEFGHIFTKDLFEDTVQHFEYKEIPLD